MDWTIVLTGIGTVASVVGVNITLFSWIRADVKEIKAEAAADRRDILNLVRSINQEIQKEMKDFHGRLCAIEERNKK